MRLPSPLGEIGWREALFSVKTFLAAMLALWISFRLGLSKPSWAMITVYIVSHPLSGAATSKALYRVTGTVLGAVVTILLVPNFVNVPWLLCLCLAGWVSLCLYISLLDRTPRSYIFMLGGYTAAIIGFTVVGDPGMLFDTAIARVEEITIGILCASIVNRLIFPRDIAPLVIGKIDTWLEDARTWTMDVLTQKSGMQKEDADAKRLAADTVGMLELISYLPYDTSSLRTCRQQLLLLEQHMAALIPILSGVGDRIGVIGHEQGHLPEALGKLIVGISAWIASPDTADGITIDNLRKEILQLEQQSAREKNWDALLTWNLCARLRDLVDVWEDCLVLRRGVALGNMETPPHLETAARFAGEPKLHLDRGLALISSAAVFVSILLCCIFWIGLGWNDGLMAVQLTSVFGCLFAALDNPVTMHKTHFWYLAGAVCVAGMYQFAILPVIDGMTMLALVLAPFFLTGGMFRATTSWGFAGLALCMNTCLFLGLDSTATPDITTFVNTGLAAAVGALFAAFSGMLLRMISMEARVLRVLRAVWADLATVAHAREKAAISPLIRRMVDRFGLLTPRMALLPTTSPLHTADVLGDMRVGLNVAGIQCALPAMSMSDRKTAGELMKALGAHFTRKLSNEHARPGKKLLRDMDEAISTMGNPLRCSISATALLHALIGIRRSLFPHVLQFGPQAAMICREVL